VLKNILIARYYNTDHLSILIDNLPNIVEENDVKLVIIDSIISHFRGEYLGRENLSDRQQKLGSCLHRLMRMAETLNVAVVITNQVQATPAVAYGDPNRPTGGNVLAHACTHRIFLRKGRQNTRIAQVIDSPSLPERKIRFAITEKGIEDLEDVKE
jgi:DNA repair protein RadA